MRADRPTEAPPGRTLMNSPGIGGRGPGMNGRRGFTLTELLVVIAIIAVLAALLLPVLSKSKDEAQRARCLNNQKQLNLAWQMYADDHNGNLPLNETAFRSASAAESPPGSWVTGNAGLDSNPKTITDGSLYPYVKNVQTYRCPVNHSLVLGTTIPILRTYSLSCYMAGPPADTNWGVVPVLRSSLVRSPSLSLTFLEEDDSTIDDGHFLYSTAINNWLNIPSWSHQNGATLTFADGHGEHWKWRSALPKQTYFSTGSALTDPLALQDISRIQLTAVGAK